MAIRVVVTNQVVQDQVDLFEGDFYTRIPGLTDADVECLLFFDNTLVNWPLVTGTFVDNAQVLPGSVYFHEISTNPGFYAVRTRFNIPGYWRLVINYTPGAMTVSLDYDAIVNAGGSCGEGGIRSSFVR